MKQIVFAVLLLFCIGDLFSQDIIVKNNGENIKAKISEVGITEIRYKRWDNLNGPIMVISKQDVATIKYKNGTKEIINSKGGATASTKSVTETKPGKPKPEPVVCKRTVEDVYKTTKIYFYGYDYSHMKFVEDEKENDGGRIYKTIPAWQRIVNEHHDQKFMERTTKIDTVVMLTEYGIAQSKNADSTKILSMKPQSLIKDSVQNWVRRYEFKEKDGIGYLIFIDCFHKAEKNSALTFVFFDIASKQILLYDKYDKSEADGYGLPHYWAQSVSVTVARFNGDKIKKVRKKL